MKPLVQTIKRNGKKKTQGSDASGTVLSQFSLLLPTLNERENIEPQIRAILRALPSIHQILVLDDRSTDGTPQAVKSEFRKEIRSKKIIVIERKKNFGLAKSLKEGVDRSETKFIGWMDCDLSMPPGLFLKMLLLVAKDYDVCIGTRFGEGGKQKKLSHSQRDSKVEILLSNVLNAVLKRFCPLPITDFTSGFLVGRREVLKKAPWRGTHGEYFIELMFHLAESKAKLTEIPYEIGTREFGDSKTFGTLTASLVNSFRYTQVTLRSIGRALLKSSARRYKED